MKRTCIILTALLFSLKLSAQNWAKKGVTFIYSGFVTWMEVNNDKIISKKPVRFQITIDSVVSTPSAKFIFLDNYFDVLHAAAADSSETNEKQRTCLGLYRDTLYFVSFDQEPVRLKQLDARKLFANQLSNITVDKQFAVSQFDPKKKTKRFAVELAPDENEPEFTFKEFIRNKYKFNKRSACMVADDGRESYTKRIYYSNDFFITQYTGEIFRSVRHKVNISLVGVTNLIK